MDTISIVLDNSDDKDVIVQLVKCAVLKFFGNLGENKVKKKILLKEIQCIIDKCLPIFIY